MMTIRPTVRILLPLLTLMALSGCGIVGMIASGASDGTKYMIRKMDEQDAGAVQDAPATSPAAASPATAPAEPEPPAAAAAPVIPVTRGEPLD